jgi:hypothetical protein
LAPPLDRLPPLPSPESPESLQAKSQPMQATELTRATPRLSRCMAFFSKAWDLCCAVPGDESPHVTETLNISMDSDCDTLLQQRTRRYRCTLCASFQRDCAMFFRRRTNPMRAEESVLEDQCSAIAT